MRAFGIVVFTAAVAAACKTAPAPTPATTASASTHPRRGEGAMREVRASTMADKLRAAGLDPANLPPIETLDRKTKLGVMRTFTEALGVACVDCHAGVDFAADTRRKRVAKRMWNEMTRVVALESTQASGALYCDSCHQGDLFILDRRDKAKVTTFMTDVYDQKLKRTDGKDHDCATCHGDPPNMQFLTTWRESPAPDIAK